MALTNSSLHGTGTSHTIKSPSSQPSGGSLLETFRKRHETRSLDEMKIEEVVGAGTFGVVYRAMDTRATPSEPHGCRVALKKIKMERESQGFPITALREIKVLKLLRHENIVHLREIVTCDSEDATPDTNSETTSSIDVRTNTTTTSRGNDYKSKHIFYGDIFMVFEFVDFDLAGLLQSPHFRLTNDLIKSYIHQLLIGVKFLHEKRVLHRDLKCANLLITRNNVVKIADWGLARTVPAPSRQQVKLRLTVPVVTLWYRSPEVILKHQFYGPELDIWSVGCIFCELFTRTALFNTNADAKQIEAIFSLLGYPSGKLLERYSQLPEWKMVAPRHGGTESKLRETYNPVLKDPLAMDLLERMLDLDFERRPDSTASLNMPYFTQTRVKSPSELPVIEIESATEYSEQERRKREGRQEKGRPQPGPGAAPAAAPAAGAPQKLPGGHLVTNAVGVSREHRDRDRQANTKLGNFKVKKPGQAGGAAAPSASVPSQPSGPPTSGKPEEQPQPKRFRPDGN